MIKTCIKCNQEKSYLEYAFRKDTQNYRNKCKKCCQIRINYYKRTNDEYKKRYNEYRKSRRKQDIQFCLMDRLRARVRKMLNSQNGKKYLKTQEQLGCSYDTFKYHIEKQFYGDMSWELKNFELDHIIPCSWFDLSNPIHQKICFNYKNIQPLTSEDNAKKSDKIWLDFNLMKNSYI
jgi:hypothetical protein